MEGGTQTLFIKGERERDSQIAYQGKEGDKKTAYRRTNGDRNLLSRDEGRQTDTTYRGTEGDRQTDIGYEGMDGDRPTDIGYRWRQTGKQVDQISPALK